MKTGGASKTQRGKVKALTHFLDPDAKNKFCSLKDLKNEADVEQNFLVYLLDELGYIPEYRENKAEASAYKIGKGKKRREYVPDYICFTDKAHKKPVLLIDAKHPNEDPLKGVEDAQLYASVLRRSLKKPKPDQFCVGTNGVLTVVKHYDEDAVLHVAAFDTLVDGNPKFEALKAELGRDARMKAIKVVGTPFEFKKPDVNEIRGIFEACHQAIWTRDFESPVPAFWEFCKLMFVKLNEDKKLHRDPDLKPLIEAGAALPADKIPFSAHYIDRMNATDSNPIATLFENVRNELEEQIAKGKKKRIFDTDEKLDLKPLTVKRVVELLEHHDLIRIDEDLNGRLFQTFLSATMRGKQLGQFFTPRTVVEFMCDLVDLSVTKDPPYAPYVADACCGTGGFLIEAMAKMVEQVKKGALSTTMTPEERFRIEAEIKDDHLFGVDAGKDPPVARIARINMYLHGDGGSRIYHADALDKKVRIPAATPLESKLELEELRNLLSSRQFDVVLTNPPFSMKKDAKESDQREILEDYELAYHKAGTTRKLRSGLRSNVMFLERYYGLLRPSGKLVTVIDESVLNTQTAKAYRVWLLRNFYVSAIFSLPQLAFFEAGANVKTTILRLEKKGASSDDQPLTFFARSNNIGYAGSKLNEARSDLPQLLAGFRKFQSTGEIPQTPKTHWTEPTRFFAAQLTPGEGRIDLEWHDPRHSEMEVRLASLSSKGYRVETLGSLCDLIKGKTADEYVSSGVPILKVRNITGEGIDWDTDFILRLFYDANAPSHLKRDDVLVTSTGLGTIGRVDLFDKDGPCMTDGHIASLRVRGTSDLSVEYLAHYLRSPLGQVQMDRYTVGSTGQRELNDPDIEKIRVAYPPKISAQKKVLEEVKAYEDEALRARTVYRENMARSKLEFAKLLGL